MGTSTLQFILISTDIWNLSKPLLATAWYNQSYPVNKPKLYISVRLDRRFMGE